MSMIELLEAWGPVIPQPIGQPIAGRVRLMGFSGRETSGAATALLLITNQPAGAGLETMSAFLAASATVRDWFGPNGILLANGYFPSVTGALSGSAFLRYMGEGGI